MTKLIGKTITAPLTINVSGAPIWGLRDRVRVLLGRPVVAAPFLVQNCVFQSGTQVPCGFWPRLQLCISILRGQVPVIESPQTKPMLSIQYPDQEVYH